MSNFGQVGKLHGNGIIHACDWCGDSFGVCEYHVETKGDSHIRQYVETVRHECPACYKLTLKYYPFKVPNRVKRNEVKRAETK